MSKLRLRWTVRSLEDLYAIGDFIARDRPTAARSWVEKLRRRAQAATSLRYAGRVVPEIDREDIRELLERTYRIVYRVTRKEIIVLTVFEGHRTLDELDPDQDE